MYEIISQQVLSIHRYLLILGKTYLSYTTKFGHGCSQNGSHFLIRVDILMLFHLFLLCFCARKRDTIRFVTNISRLSFFSLILMVNFMIENDCIISFLSFFVKLQKMHYDHIQELSLAFSKNYLTYKKTTTNTNFLFGSKQKIYYI